MKKIIISLFAFFALINQGDLRAEEDLTQLDHLIVVTEQNLGAQTALREQIKKYLDLKEVYLKNPHDKELLIKTAKEASKALELIQEYYLAQVFSAEFMKELTLFANFAKKPMVPKPL